MYFSIPLSCVNSLNSSTTSSLLPNLIQIPFVKSSQLATSLLLWMYPSNYTSALPSKHIEAISELTAEYNKILTREEVFWYQKSSCQRILLGDKNTKYFYMKAVIGGRRIESVVWKGSIISGYGKKNCSELWQ